MGEFERVVGVLFDDQTVRPSCRFSVRMASKICRAIRRKAGDGSSSISRRGGFIPADRQHLLLAVGQRSAALGHPLLQPGNSEDAFQPGRAVGLAGIGGTAPSAGFDASCGKIRPLGRLGTEPGHQRRHTDNASRPSNYLAGAGAGLAEDRQHQRRSTAPLAPIKATISP
jgi:hypothetical protein